MASCVLTDNLDHMGRGNVAPWLGLVAGNSALQFANELIPYFLSPEYLVDHLVDPAQGYGINVLMPLPAVGWPTFVEPRREGETLGCGSACRV